MLQKVYCSKCGRESENLKRKGNELSFVCKKCGTRNEIKVLDKETMLAKYPDLGEIMKD